ncbi:MAG: hypothetical protein LC623_06005, partial [Halobacteriales archaeon]|nr:hypothetical protein [Halobacteriales archaeon]
GDVVMATPLATRATRKSDPTPPCGECGGATEPVFQQAGGEAFVRIPHLFYCAQDDSFSQGGGSASRGHGGAGTGGQSVGAERPMLEA